MKTKELLAFTRTVLHDAVKPYEFTDETLVEYLSEGQEKAARNARLIRDYSTAEICRIPISTTKQAYEIDARAIFVRRVALDSRGVPLGKASFKDLDRKQPGWIGRTGTPNWWCTDFETGKLWLDRKPTVADTARIMVVRLPLCSLSTSKLNDALELPVPYHRPVHHWACYRAYSNQDADTYDEKAAARHMAAFTAEFGDDSSALDEEWARQHYGESDMEGEL